ncbi:DUF1330 domain-containing protein [Ruixingdingia sedimenti]|uniref:DUF1330 domain-containing protein n=1 Tax=Ruixingdingia sedimenti TaxID=3073604 RepID=A0ABU1F5L6_9RHOB|nr:DUF1330 domain-containing protein [Xinfangfangia sp. LG-4]MDR5651729.1 DUF1330 domain-containing protein [Xinfangfangia sp. LG-4]
MPALFIAIRERTRDAAEMETYSALARQTLAGRAFRLLARYEGHDGLEGPEPEAVLVMEFPTMADARAWYHSDDYRAALRHRNMGADYRVLLVETKE